MVNQHRSENGLSSLKVSTSLTETATTRAKEISNKYSHYRPNGTLCLNSMYELYGENLACGFSGGDLVFRAWSKSTAHDSNMLNTRPWALQYLWLSKMINRDIRDIMSLHLASNFN